jgi:spastic paraplegia protein 7
VLYGNPQQKPAPEPREEKPKEGNPPSSSPGGEPSSSSSDSNNSNNNKQNDDDKDNEDKISALLLKAFLWMLTAYMFIAIVSLLFPGSNQPEVRRN